MTDRAKEPAFRRHKPLPGLRENRIANPSPPSSPQRPRIGLFDSGVGGLSVWREVTAQLAGVDTVYLGDRAHCPYGRRGDDEIAALSERLVRALLGEGCGLVVVACNTATAAAIDGLRTAFRVPIVGMEPAVKPAALRTRLGVVGVLATAGTLRGRLFQETSARFVPAVRYVVRIAEDLVDLVEAGLAGTAAARTAVEAHLRPMLAEGIDSLVLGCTHFPFLEAEIRAVAGPGVRLFDPAAAVARQVKRRWLELNPPVSVARPGRHRFACTGDPALLRAMVGQLGWSTRDDPEPLAGLPGSQTFRAEWAEEARAG